MSSSSCLEYRIAAAFRLFGVLVVAYALACFGAPCARAQAPGKQLRVAAAAELEPVMPFLAAAYEQATGVRVLSSFGSSQSLAQQLEHGHQQDLFLSGDYVHAEQLVADGLAASTAPVEYARGALVLWARHDSPAQPLNLDSLSSSAVKKIAVTNDQDSVYGMGATRALASLGVTGRVSSKLVAADDVTQTAQLAESGQAQVAMIPLTLAASPHLRQLGSYVRFPATSYPEIRQCAIVVKASKNQAAALLFLNWLTSYSVQHNLGQFGLDPAR